MAIYIGVPEVGRTSYKTATISGSQSRGEIWVHNCIGV